MKTNKTLIVSLILNVLTFLLVLVGVIMTFTLKSSALVNNDLSVFKYFTFQSNIFVAIVAIIYAIFQFLVIKGKKEKVPHVLHVFYHVGVTAVGLTGIVVVTFLATQYGFALMYYQANLFYHGLVPLIALINFMFFAKDCRLKFIETLFAALPSILYGIVYFIAVASLNGYGDYNIDFYMFGANGPLFGVISFLIVSSTAYAIGVGIYFINYLVFKKRK